MSSPDIHAVTGAFGYSGKYIAQRLLDRGKTVITLTNSPNRENPFAGAIRPFPFNFDRPDKLTESLAGVSVLYNTYWVRFNHKTFTHAGAANNSDILFQSAKRAGVQRIVHISILNASDDSPLEYFSAKARVERLLQATGISHAILRPAVLFGKEDILVNNIAWTLRHLPVFAVFGDGRYKIQPIYVDDLAELAVHQGEQRTNTIINAIGPETFTYRDFVRQIARIIEKRRPLIPLPPWLGYLGAWFLGKLTHDVMITRDEIRGLMCNRLYVDAPPTGWTALTDWATAHADALGRHYASELARRRNRLNKYATL